MYGRWQNWSIVPSRDDALQVATRCGCFKRTSSFEIPSGPPPSSSAYKASGCSSTQARFQRQPSPPPPLQLSEITDIVLNMTPPRNFSAKTLNTRIRVVGEATSCRVQREQLSKLLKDIVRRAATYSKRQAGLVDPFASEAGVFKARIDNINYGLQTDRSKMGRTVEVVSVA